MDFVPLTRAVLVAFVWLAQPAAADQTDARLSPLFEELQQADGPAVAASVEAQIWGIWSDSGDETANELMAAGSAALTEQDGEKALAAFSRVTELLPNFAEGWNKRATTLYLLGRFVDSEVDIARVLALEPRHFGALSGLGLCEVRRDRLEQAVAAFKQALAVNPNMPGVKANLRNLLVELSKRSI